MKIVSLQYCRGLASLLVVVAHNAYLLPLNAGLYISGALGVDIFFIISGFIMTYITHGVRERPYSFLIKRFFRIWPVFFIVWLGVFFISDESRRDTISCALYFCLQDYSRPGPTFGYSALGPPWTLTYEILFYLIFTFSMFVCYRYRSLLCSLMFVFSAVIFQLLYNGHFEFSSQASPSVAVSAWWQAWIKLISNTIMFEFITGMLVAELFIRGWLTLSSPGNRRAAQIVLTGLVAAAFAVGPQVFGLSGGYWLAAAIFTLAVAAVPVEGHSSQRILLFLGDISYSLYLIHYPLKSLLTPLLAEESTAPGKIAVFMLSVSGSIVLAYILYTCIERPAIAMGKKVAGLMQGWLKDAVTS